MDIRLLEAVVAVADELHFGRAAARLGIAQPPLSQRVQRLERELGVTVFDRGRHGVAITPAGTEIVAHARRVVADTRRLTRIARGVRAGTHGTLRIGAVGSAFYAALPDLLAAGRADLPDLTLRIREVETPQQIAELHAGDLDVGFLRPPVDAGLDTRVVWREPLIVALPGDHPLAAEPEIDIARIAAEPIVFFARASGPGYWDRVNALLHAAGHTLEPAARADHVTTMLGMVALGIGVTIVPDSARALRLAGVTYRPLLPRTELPLAVATDPAARTPVIDALLATLPDAGALR